MIQRPFKKTGSNKSWELLENEHALTYHRRGQSTLMMRCLSEQILGNRLEIFSTCREIYLLDVEVVKEAELNEQKQFCTIPIKGSKEKKTD